MSVPVMFNCRFPAGVREAVAEAAQAAGRSQTNQIIHMLRQEPSGPLPDGMQAVGARSGYQFGLRMPSELHEGLSAVAARNGRSLQGEVLYRVMSALGADAGAIPEDAAGTEAHSSKPLSLTVRLTREQRARLDAASSIGPYKVSFTEIVARGIELAAQELEAMASKGDL